MTWFSFFKILAQIGSRQYIVIPGRYIYVQRLKDANVNDKVWIFFRFFISWLILYPLCNHNIILHLLVL